MNCSGLDHLGEMAGKAKIKIVRESLSPDRVQSASVDDPAPIVLAVRLIERESTGEETQDSNHVNCSIRTERTIRMLMEPSNRNGFGTTSNSAARCSEQPKNSQKSSMLESAIGVAISDSFRSMGRGFPMLSTFSTICHP